MQICKMNLHQIALIFFVQLCVWSLSTLAGTAKDGELEIHHIFKNNDCARKAKPTDVLTLHYKGTLEDGTVFDSSHDREPFSFQLGIGQVIKGWDKGLVGVCEEDKLKLVIPPILGYGFSDAHAKIPPNSIIIFEVHILKIGDGPNPINVFKDIDVNKDDKLSKEEVQQFLKTQLAGTDKLDDQSAVLEEIFQHEDQDKDGYITREEFSGPKYDHEEL